MNRLHALAALMTLALTASACGSGGQTAPSAPAAATAAAEAAGAAQQKAAKVVIGTSTTYPKVFYIDEKGNLTGFDVELVKEIDKRLPDYEFELQAMDFTNLLLSLETRKIDVIAAQMLRTKEREQKYLFNKEPYTYRQTKIIVSKDNNSPIKTLDDLKGKKVLTNATSAQAVLLENYNKAHDNALSIVYQSGAADDAVSQLASGRVDATLAADFTLSLIDPQGKLKSVGGALDSSEVLYVFRKDDPAEQKLADAFDKALQAIRSDGTLTRLSERWLGADYTKSPAP
ncbi:transporter substrate-binding domain-containing protein [Paenibacillus hodogayensis]|uniref:Transporter substrate-binding domain-containing protein n=1 Tax=Paenibacillus hodogayensis TaxID=279208 RepID=A0ABV5W6N8_9BACL